MRFFLFGLVFVIFSAALPAAEHEYDCTGVDPNQNKVHFYIDRQLNSDDQSQFKDIANYQRVGTLEVTPGATNAVTRTVQVERMFAENFLTTWRSLGGLSLDIDNDNFLKPPDQKLFRLVTPALNGAEAFAVKCKTPGPGRVLNRATAVLAFGQAQLFITVDGGMARNLLLQYLLTGGSNSGESIFCAADGSFCAFEVKADGTLVPARSIPQSDRNIARDAYISGVQREPFKPEDPVRLDLVIRGDGASAIVEFTANSAKGKSFICTPKTPIQEATCALRLDQNGKAYPYEIIK
jgi:hypothetical protein